MNCYLCSKEPPAGGMHFADSRAVAICSRCSTAMCEKHLIFTSQEEGKKALCATCAATAGLNTPALTGKGKNSK